ncbi:hypothetical protein LBMAG42_20170 [Deltaproteobacteria bacterium]|nr:hypothetical protein LBMAG42_20170 [Deltaproteobacteria bacterium]
MNRRTTMLLHEQLKEALAEWRRGEAEGVEVAAIAGLLERLDAGCTLAAAEARADATEGILWVAEDDTDALVDAIVEAEAEDPIEERLEALLALDEFCAAATWAGVPEVAAEPASVAAACVRAAPTPWVDLAVMASRLLASAPPVGGDPAVALWGAVAMAGIAQAERDREYLLVTTAQGISPATEGSLGNVVTFSPCEPEPRGAHPPFAAGVPIRPFQEWARYAASSPGEVLLNDNDTAELFEVIERCHPDSGDPCLLVRCLLVRSSAPPTVEHEGAPVEPEHIDGFEGHFWFTRQGGLWSVQLAGSIFTWQWLRAAAN